MEWCWARQTTRNAQELQAVESKEKPVLLDKELLEAFGVPVSEQRARQCGIQPYAIPADIPLSDVVGFLGVWL